MGNFLGGIQYKEGDAVKANRLNLDQDAASSARGTNCVGGYLKRFSGGMSITIPRYSRAAASTASIQPFDIITSGVTAGYIRVQPGVINNVMPVNMFTAFTYATGSTQYLVVDCAMSSAKVISATLSITGGLVAPASAMGVPPTGCQIALGVLSDTHHARVIGAGSVWLTTTIAYVEAAIVSPGMPPYNEFYTYTVK